MSELTLGRLIVPDVIDGFRRYVAIPGNEVGGNLHIVLDDKNVDDDDVEWCRQHAIEMDDELGAHLALVLLGMSRTQRLKIAHKCWSQGD